MSEASRKDCLVGERTYLTENAKIVLAIRMPNDSTELIINQNAIDKISYIENAYDDDLCLKTNPAIKIANYMIYE